MSPEIAQDQTQPPLSVCATAQLQGPDGKPHAEAMWFEAHAGDVVRITFKKLMVNGEPLSVRETLPSEIPDGHIAVVGHFVTVNEKGVVEQQSAAWHQEPGGDMPDLPLPTVDIGTGTKRRVRFSDGKEAVIEGGT
jgi:hypothetical protein